MKKKKNRFWLFVFSLCPGAGHMYMGFMRMGLSFLLGFMTMVAVIAYTQIDVLAVFPAVLYIYSFFHANNIGGLDDEQFAAMEDEYLFGIGDMGYDRFLVDKKNRSIAAAVLIIMGITMLWRVAFGILRDYINLDNFYVKAIFYTMKNDIPRVVIAIIIIWFGVRMLRGKRENDAETEVCEKADGQSGQIPQIEQRGGE